MQTTETMERLIAPDAPEYITIKQAADAVSSRPWSVAEFGPHIGIMALEHPLGTLDDRNRDELTAQELRQLAADALAAAQWLEAYQ